MLVELTEEVVVEEEEEEEEKEEKEEKGEQEESYPGVTMSATIVAPLREGGKTEPGGAGGELPTMSAIIVAPLTRRSASKSRLEALACHVFT